MKSLEIKRVPMRHVTAGHVKKAIAAVVHGQDFISALGFQPNHPLINFDVKLNDHDTAGHHYTNNGSGTIIFPTDQIQSTFWRLYRKGGLTTTLDGRKATLYFHPSDYEQKIDRRLIDELVSTPYIDPSIEEERQEMVRLLEFGLRVNELQVGMLFRKTYPGVRTFSVEWSRCCEETVGRIKYDYDTKSIQISMHDPSKYTKQMVVVPFVDIRKVAIGFDFGNPYICIDNLVPPRLEKRDAYPTLTGRAGEDKKIQRATLLGSLCKPHEAVAPYAYQLRVSLTPGEDIAKFIKLGAQLDICPLLMDLRGKACIESEGHKFTTLMRGLALKFKSLPFAIGFQLEALIRNNMLNPHQAMSLLPKLEELSLKHNDDFIDQLLRRYAMKLREDPTHVKDPAIIFQMLSHRIPSRSPSDTKMFDCYHVTCTPSRLILEGPYPTGFNRIIRRYRDFAHCFLRVEFRDENGQYIRDNFDVDASPLVKDRIGGILQDGFEIAGQYFEFLAYASSSLKVHSTWFIHPFTDERGVYINAQRIRDEIVPPSIVANDDLRTKPSKYAARIALAFTTSEAWDTVRLKRNEWDGSCSDIYPHPPTIKVRHHDDYGDPVEKDTKLPPFTDGVGTMSQKLRDRIWEASKNPDSIRPSAYMLRFLGFKGVISVDPELDKDPSGIQLRMRPSMKKFESWEDDPTVASEVAIDIAEVYDKPKKFYLNRPLIMLLEHLGVPVDAFRTLQNAAVAEAKTVDASLEQFSRFMDNHHLGNPFQISQLASRFQIDLGLTLEQIDNTFWKNLRQISFNHVMAVIRYEARILVPQSYLLVGVADEGPIYQQRGYTNVFTLPPNSIFACIQEDKDSEPIWLKGTCAVTRNPVVHRGDVQRVYAIGEPPLGMFCAFRHLRNVVVFPSEGPRSLPSCLAGGDLDGDQYAVIQYDPLLPPETHDPANPDTTLDDRRLPNGGTVQASDICDFIVEYINSDVLGMLSVKLLRMADQLPEGYDDENCIALASLCSQAVDYPKKGVAVPSHLYERFRTPKKYKPDWERGSSNDESSGVFYTSSRALGHLYRAKHFDDMGRVVTEGQEASSNERAPARPYTDAISLAIKQMMDEYLGVGVLPAVNLGREFRVHQMVEDAFQQYSEELRYIRFTHSLYAKPESRLLEVEVVAGTIECRRDLKKLRKERISRMRDHTASAVKRVRAELMGAQEEKSIQTLQLAWNAWGFSQVCKEEGANSFGLIALRVIFDCWDTLAKQ